MPKIEKPHVPMELSKAREHAAYLIQHGYVKGKTIDEVVELLQKPEADRPTDPFTFQELSK
jgi:hypothetical protein